MAEPLLFFIASTFCFQGEAFMWRSMTVAFVLAAAFLLNAVPAHAQRWGRGATPRSGVCFYEDINYGGRHFCADAGAATPPVSSRHNHGNAAVRPVGDALPQRFSGPKLR